MGGDNATSDVLALSLLCTPHVPSQSLGSFILVSFLYGIDYLTPVPPSTVSSALKLPSSSVCAMSDQPLDISCAGECAISKHGTEHRDSFAPKPACAKENFDDIRNAILSLGELEYRTAGRWLA